MTYKNVVVWGSGFIASHLDYEHIKSRAVPDPSVIRSILTAYKTDVLINCIGYCGERNIDQCLDNKEKTIYANTVLPIMIANECNKLGIQMIHISSGCIFQGNSPHFSSLLVEGAEKRDDGWQETDFASPPSFYAQTKYACDLAISHLSNVCALRIRMPISDKTDPRNIISKLRGYPSIINEPNSMTFVSDLARCIDWCIDNHKAGIYNVVNEPKLTAVQLMNAYQKYFPTHQFNIISLKQLGQLTKDGRSNCILDGSKLKKEGFSMTPAKEALTTTMASYVKNMGHNV
jgi:dTDP-4-dehydrorhamnose reductase